MGACSGKKPEQQPQPQQESQPLVAPPQEVENEEPSRLLSVQELSEDILQQQLISETIRTKFREKCPLVEVLPNMEGLQADQALRLAVKIGGALQDQEDQIYALISKVPTGIFGNYINIALTSIIELQQEKIDNTKSHLVCKLSLEITVETFHIVQYFICNEKNPWFDESKISNEITLKYNDLQGKIKIELVSHYGKVMKSKTNTNNPMMPMRFNTKHALGLAKQQTLKDKVVDNPMEDGSQYSQLAGNISDQRDFDSLFDAINIDLKDKIDKLKPITSKFKDESS